MYYMSKEPQLDYYYMHFMLLVYQALPQIIWKLAQTGLSVYPVLHNREQLRTYIISPEHVNIQGNYLQLFV